MNNACILLMNCVLAVSSWLSPEPALTSGRIYVYGNQQLVLANFAWHGYDPAPTHGCGLASISPAHLGRIAWVSVDRRLWLGPCLVVDVQGRDDALDSIYRRHEIAEVDRKTAGVLGFKYGAAGFVAFSACPPDGWARAEPYQPPLALDTGPLDWTPSLYPYPPQQAVETCY